MAVIDLNNIIRPKQQNNPSTAVNKVVVAQSSVYTDLHLDLIQQKSVGVGLEPAQVNDILVDKDIEAIKNSLRNIFTTKKGQKILNPEFGCSLEQYLFTPINEVIAKAIGTDILNAISNYEPRINLLNVNIVPYYDRELYYITLLYKMIEINRQETINLVAQIGGQVLV